MPRKGYRRPEMRGKRPLEEIKTLHRNSKGRNKDMMGGGGYYPGRNWFLLSEWCWLDGWLLYAGLQPGAHRGTTWCSRSEVTAEETQSPAHFWLDWLITDTVTALSHKQAACQGVCVCVCWRSSKRKQLVTGWMNRSEPGRPALIHTETENLW